MKPFKVSSLKSKVARAARLSLNVKPGTSDLKRQGVAISVLLALLFAPAIAIAQAINDPTRPPAIIFSGAPGETGAVAAPLLQSVMITPTERSAIIGGERVKLGGKYGDARVVKITESEVVLRSSSGTETLRMYPEVTMKPVAPAPPISKKPVGRNRGPAANTRGKQG